MDDIIGLQMTNKDYSLFWVNEKFSMMMTVVLQ